jgi:hypothetical protein
MSKLKQISKVCLMAKTLPDTNEVKTKKAAPNWF